MRCGLLGPVLEAEFRRALPAAGVEVLEGPVPVTNSPATETAQMQGEIQQEQMTARVGLISHIGGHKWAGNVIVYVPPSAKGEGGEGHPLAGMGIWYGRVEPKHVAGLVQATVKEGKVIEEFFRGGVQKGKGLLHLPLKARK